jgi:Heterokaryon incompatibility protein (HET)
MGAALKANQSKPHNNALRSQAGPINFATHAEKVMYTWLNECVAHHAPCRMTEDNPPLPRRVVDVGSSDPIKPPFLHISDGQRDKYATLSYCWGSLPILLKTTNDTILERRSGIRMEDLPATIRDSILLTRTLGIQYLWIDSLCILQDSPTDWEIESASMASIYRLSTVTIVATTARNAYEGCAPCRNKLALVPCAVTGYDGAIHVQNQGRHVPYDKPIDQRGWTFQESQLSPRLLHCDGEQISWQCLCSDLTEADPVGNGYQTIPRNMQAKWQIRSGDQGERRALVKSAPTFQNWYDLVQVYSERTLTFADDKLPGIAGLADHFRDSLSGQPSDSGLNYLSGLWKEDLLWGLMWRNVGNSTSYIYRSPSWSWTTLDAGVLHEDMGSRILPLKPCAEVLDANVVVRGLNPFGKVTSGKVTLYGPLAPLPAAIFEEETYKDQPGTYKKKRSRWMFPVVQWDRQIPPSIDSVCLRAFSECGLILTPVKKPFTSGIYTRTGYIKSTENLRRRQTEPNLLDGLEWRPAVVTMI